MHALHVCSSSTPTCVKPINARGYHSLRRAALFDFFKLGMLLVATYQFNVNSGMPTSSFHTSFHT